MSENAGAPAAPVESAAPSESNTESVQGQENSSESGQPSAEDIQAAVEGGEISEAQAQKIIKKLKIKVQGKEQEITYDPSDEAFLRDQFQLAEMSKRSMQSAAELKKQYVREMDRLRNDPMGVLAELGLDPEEVSAGFIQKKIEEMKKSPEQLASEKMQKEMDELRTKLKQKEDAEKEAITSKMNEQAKVQLNEEIDRAISGHKKLPNSPMVRKKIADTMLWAINEDPEKYGDITAEDVIPLVEKELRQELGGLFEGLEDEAFEEWVGKERLAKARKKKAPVLPTKNVPGLANVKPTTGSVRAQEAAKEEPRKVRAKDFFRGR